MRGELKFLKGRPDLIEQARDILIEKFKNHEKIKKAREYNVYFENGPMLPFKEVCRAAAQAANVDFNEDLFTSSEDHRNDFKREFGDRFKIIRRIECDHLAFRHSQYIRIRHELLPREMISNPDLLVAYKLINENHVEVYSERVYGDNQELQFKNFYFDNGSGKNNIGYYLISLRKEDKAVPCKEVFLTFKGFEMEKTRYWVVNGFEQKHIMYDFEHDVYVMQFQYNNQYNSTVSKRLSSAHSIKPGDKVLLYNKNNYYAYGEFSKVKKEDSQIISLQKQIENGMGNDSGKIYTYEDADCYYEDLRSNNGFDGEFGERLKVKKWQGVNSDGIYHPGIKTHLTNGLVNSTILELKDETFYKEVKNILEENKFNNIMNNGSEIERLLKYKKQIILQGPPGTGKTYLAKQIAKQMTGEEPSTQGNVRLVQFHPSYSYEDFVRGIVVETVDGSVDYNPTNKTLLEMVDIASKNLEDSTKDESEIAQKEWAKVYFDDFVEKVTEKIDVMGNFKITDNCNIVSVEDDAFRYAGNWSSKHRMKFSDLIGAQLAGVKSRKDLKKWKKGKGQAAQHASYYIKVLNLFQKEYGSWLNEKPDKTYGKPDRLNYLLIIDEINRANLPSVLGELIYALEYRNKPVVGMYEYDESKEIRIPDNLYIIGTMNTADRSVGHIDYAIRRRFAFVDCPPKVEIVQNQKDHDTSFGVALFKKVEALFNEGNLNSDFKKEDVQIGHSYFMIPDDDSLDGKSEKEILEMRLEYEIKPILREYVKDGVLNESILKEINELKV